MPAMNDNAVFQAHRGGARLAEILKCLAGCPGPRSLHSSHVQPPLPGTRHCPEFVMPYLISLAIGLGVGLLYGALNVRSPAPPAIALVGLLGMLAGEQLWPMGRQLISNWLS